MSPTLTATRWHSDRNTPDITSSFSDGNDTVFMTAWPRMFYQDFPDDPSAPSVPPPPSRRMMPQDPHDGGKPASTADKKKPVKKPDPAPSSPRGAPKKHKPEKKPDPPSPPVAKKPPPPPLPAKKHKADSGNPKKKKPEPEPSGSSPGSPGIPKAPEKIPEKPENPQPPQVKNIPLPPNPLPQDSGSDIPPASIPEIGTAAPPPEDAGGTEVLPVTEPHVTASPPNLPEALEDPVTAEDSSNADESIPNSLEADIGSEITDPLTEANFGAFIDERMNTNAVGLFEKANGFFRDLFSDIFTTKTVAEPADSSTQYYVPTTFSTPQKPEADPGPVGSFRAGYISQRDLETAIGRDDWTMCCAASFVYAVQAKYPGLGRDEILEAAGRAANTPLADGSGSCVADNGYIGSIYQYSQALSENLGLDEYLDTPGQYPSVEAAREAGVEVMKVKLSGTLRGLTQEHHILQIQNSTIDPAPGGGIEDIWDKQSSKVDNVMALNWYSLP